MRLHLRLDRVVLFDITLFEPADDDGVDIVDAIADVMPFGFVAPDIPYPDPAGNEEDDDE